MNGPLSDVKESTMNSYIRSTDKRKRRTVNPVKRLPIQATGKTIGDIHGYQVSSTEFKIESRTKKGDMILTHNRRLGRDPIVVSDQAMNIVEKEIIKHIDKVIRSI